MRPRLLAAALLLPLAVLPPLAPARAQMRSVGPGVADRTNILPRGGGGGEDIVYGGEVQTALELDVNGRQRALRGHGNLYTESLAAGYLLLPYGFAVNGVLRLEQTPRMPDGRGSVFREQTLWADELYLVWSRGVLDLYGGKLHPRFGSAWDRGPGLYGTDFGREYELTEKIGFGARVWISDLLGLTPLIGAHNFLAEVFQADRTFLSSSVFNPRFAQTRTVTDPETGEPIPLTVYRARSRRGTGGPDNSDFPGGTVLSLAGFGIPMPRGQAGYTLSYSARRPGEDAAAMGRAATEQGFTAGGFWTLPLPQRTVLAPFVEYARQENAAAVRGRTADWLTAGFDLRRAPWTLAYTYMTNSNVGFGDNGSSDNTRLVRTENTASLTYDLYFVAPLPILRPAIATVGWRQLRAAGVVANDFGGLLGWAWKF